MMKLQEDCDLQLRTSPKAKINNKNKILDRHKLICRVVVHNFKTIPHVEFLTSNTSSNFKFVANTIRQGLQESRTFIKEANNNIATQSIQQIDENKKISTIDSSSPNNINNKLQLYIRRFNHTGCRGTPHLHRAT